MITIQAGMSAFIAWACVAASRGDITPKQCAASLIVGVIGLFLTTSNDTRKK